MKQLTKIGRLLYGIGLVSVGIHHFILNDFRSEILPPVPAWVHHFMVFPILTGAALVFSGAIISGLLNIKLVSTKNTCLYLGFCFLALITIFQLPYIFIFSPYKALRLDVWFGAGEALAYCGGAFVIAGSFSTDNMGEGRRSPFILLLEKLIPAGRIFYSILIIMFGFSHFVFTAFVSTMVPKWAGAPMFWTYFFGVALIASGMAMIFKLWIKLTALLQAFMLFLFFIFFHVPDAIANPTAGGGNEIVRAIIALLFCGISLVIASTSGADKFMNTDEGQA